MTQIDGYHHGNGYRFTGNTEVLYGVAWREARLIEGSDEGKGILIMDKADKDRATPPERQREFRCPKCGALSHDPPSACYLSALWECGSSRDESGRADELGEFWQSKLCEERVAGLAHNCRE